MNNLICSLGSLYETYRVSVRRFVIVDGVELKEGAEVVVECSKRANSHSLKFAQKINDAFLQKHNVDLQRAGLLNEEFLNIQKVKKRWLERIIDELFIIR